MTNTPNGKSEYYFIDTVYEPDKKETYYYVMHQYADGHRQKVDRPFRHYHSAEELLTDLNDHLFTGDDG